MMAEGKALSDEEIDADMLFEVPGFDPANSWAEYSIKSLRAAYRAGFEEALRRVTSPAEETR